MRLDAAVYRGPGGELVSCSWCSSRSAEPEGPCDRCKAALDRLTGAKS